MARRRAQNWLPCCKSGRPHGHLVASAVLTSSIRYRAACEALTFSNFEHASANEVEQKLWTAHLKVNTIFRQEHKIVRPMLKKTAGRQADTAQLKRSKDHVVEMRKFQKNYLHFIKASQRYYRQYILNLDAHFDGIPELRRIAQKWKDDGTWTL